MDSYDFYIRLPQLIFVVIIITELINSLCIHNDLYSICVLIVIVILAFYFHNLYL